MKGVTSDQEGEDSFALPSDLGDLTLALGVKKEIKGSTTSSAALGKFQLSPRFLASPSASPSTDERVKNRLDDLMNTLADGDASLGAMPDVDLNI